MGEREREAAAWLGVGEDRRVRPALVDAICDPRPDLSGWPAETVERLHGLTPHDRDEVLRFAAFLQAAGAAPVLAAAEGRRMIGLPEMQQKVGAWAEAAFPDHTDQSILSHLQEEVVELRQACLQRDHGHHPRLGKARDMQEEAADCLILLLTLAHRNGWNLAEAVAAKHAVNRARTWTTDAAGFSHHAGHEGSERA